MFLQWAPLRAPSGHLAGREGWASLWKLEVLAARHSITHASPSVLRTCHHYTWSSWGHTNHKKRTRAKWGAVEGELWIQDYHIFFENLLHWRSLGTLGLYASNKVSIHICTWCVIMLETIFTGMGDFPVLLQSKIAWARNSQGPHWENTMDSQICPVDFQRSSLFFNM